MILEFLTDCLNVLVWIACVVVGGVFVGVGVRVVNGLLLVAWSDVRSKCDTWVAPVFLAATLVCTVVAQKDGGANTNAPLDGVSGTNAVTQVEGGTNDWTNIEGANTVGQTNGDGTDGALSGSSPLRIGTRMRVLSSGLSPQDPPTVEPFVARPANAVENHWWRGRGAHVDGLTIPAEGWNFRTPSGFLGELLVYSYGEIQPDVETTYFPRPFPEADLSLLPEGKRGGNLPEGGESLFWHAASPSNSLILTWQNAAYGRDASCPTNLQIELFSNGTYVYRFEDRTECHSVAYPFDLDGDGLENSVDPEPQVADRDAHGTNAEWYGTVCSNVFTKIEQSNNPNSQSLLLPNGESICFKFGINTNAYYFVDVIAERGPAPIYFNSSRSGRLGSTVVVALGGETNRVPMLIGATYSITSDVPFTVQCPTNGFAEVLGSDGTSATVRWPLEFTFTEELTGTGRSYMVGVEPYNPGGTFSWGGGQGGATLQGFQPPTGGACGCISGNGNTVTFGCSPSCTCGGNCLAVGTFNFEHALFSVTGGVCTCGMERIPHEPPEVQSVARSLSISAPPILLLRDGWMTESQSAKVNVMLETPTTEVGELRIWFEHGLDKVTTQLGAPRTVRILDSRFWSCSFAIDGVSVSDSSGDVEICCSFGDLTARTSLTVVAPRRVEVPAAPSTGLAVVKGTPVDVRLIVEPTMDGLTVEWYTSRRKTKVFYDQPILVTTSGTSATLPTSTAGVFALAARVVCGTQSNEVAYVHVIDECWSTVAQEPMGSNRIGMTNHIGVASSQQLLDIRNAALVQMESTAYAKGAELPPRNGFSVVPKNSYKCNAFVADVVIAAGVAVPVQHVIRHFYSGEKRYPPVANEWANGDVTIAGWQFLGHDVYPEPGFIAGRPRAIGPGHCGIVDYDGWTISARTKAVTRNAESMLDGTIGYNKPQEVEE